MGFPVLLPLSSNKQSKLCRKQFRENLTKIEFSESYGQVKKKQNIIENKIPLQEFHLSCKSHVKEG